MIPGMIEDYELILAVSLTESATDGLHKRISDFVGLASTMHRTSRSEPVVSVTTLQMMRVVLASKRRKMRSRSALSVKHRCTRPRGP